MQGDDNNRKNSCNIVIERRRMRSPKNPHIRQIDHDDSDMDVRSPLNQKTPV